MVYAKYRPVLTCARSKKITVDVRSTTHGYKCNLQRTVTRENRRYPTWREAVPNPTVCLRVKVVVSSATDPPQVLCPPCVLAHGP